jgi:hypothetical protein
MHRTEESQQSCLIVIAQVAVEAQERELVPGLSHSLGLFVRTEHDPTR